MKRKAEAVANAPGGVGGTGGVIFDNSLMRGNTREVY
jgi:hypothetical protein